MITPLEHQTQPSHGHVLRVGAQDEWWTVRVAEDPHHPSSYILYIKMPTRNLTLSRTAREIAELDRNVHDAYPWVSHPLLLINSSVMLPLVMRNLNVQDTFACLPSSASEQTGLDSDAPYSVTTNLVTSGQVQFPVHRLTSSEGRNTALGFHLTFLLNDPIFRQVGPWRDFVRVRTGDFESAPLERAINPIGSDISMQVVSPSAATATMGSSSVADNAMRDGTEYGPREAALIEGGSSVNNLYRLHVDKNHPSSVMGAKEIIPLKVQVSDFEMICVLGKGSKGKVLLAREKTRSNFYALKVIAKRRILAEDILEYALMERAVLHRMEVERKNPFVVKLWRCFHDKDNLYLVMDFHPGGDLATQLARWGRLGHDQCRFYAAEIVEGIEGLHTAGVIHRNLKPEHILIGWDGHVVLGGFGQCKEFPRRAPVCATQDTPQMGDTPYWMKDEDKPVRPWRPHHSDTTSSFCGTAEYLAPEVIQGLPCSYGTDWWSFGTILYEMLTGIRPFDAENRSAMFDRILYDELQFPEYRVINQDTKNLIQGLLERDPLLRLCEPRIKLHSYFSVIDWAHIYYKHYKPPYIPPIDHSSPCDTQNFEDTFLNMKPVIGDEIDIDMEQELAQTTTESTDSEDSIPSPSLQHSMSSLDLPLSDTEDNFKGYSFEDRNPNILDSEEEVPERGKGEANDETTAETAALPLSRNPTQRSPESVKPSIPPVDTSPTSASFAETTLQAIMDAAEEVSASLNIFYDAPALSCPNQLSNYQRMGHQKLSLPSLSHDFSDLDCGNEDVGYAEYDKRQQWDFVNFDNESGPLAKTMSKRSSHSRL
ncbi:kinase-like domain-containing protein [Russula compacta]|nr:kinase-like domain-containing protein [Russula compacta]